MKSLKAVRATPGRFPRIALALTLILSVPANAASVWTVNTPGGLNFREARNKRLVKVTAIPAGGTVEATGRRSSNGLWGEFVVDGRPLWAYLKYIKKGPVPEVGRLAPPPPQAVVQPALRVPPATPPVPRPRPSEPDVATPIDDGAGVATGNPKCKNCDPHRPPADQLRTDANTIEEEAAARAPSPLPANPQEGAGPLSPRARCYARHLLASAKSVVRRNYGNRPRSKGWCVTAVKTATLGIGIPYISGDAVEMHQRPKGRAGILEGQGFKNRIAEFRSEKRAPSGSIFIYGGPRTDEFLRTGHYPSKKVRQRMGLGAGTWVGHATIKGDDGYHYTDGRTVEPAVANRKLVGIYILEDCKNCSARVRKECGG